MSKTIRIAIRTGKTTDKTEMIVTKMSSIVLTTGVPTPAVLASITGRATKDLAACTEPATSKPQIIDRIGLISVIDFALVANRIAPATVV